MGYTPPKNIYNANIGERELKVDIYDLPYKEFSAENPLVVFGMVSLADQQKTTNLENVRIVGGLDISKQKFSVVLPKNINGSFICRAHPQFKDAKDPKNKIDIFNEAFVFPKGVTEIDCSHSIPSLSFLTGRIPNTVVKVIVADALLNNIQSDIEKLSDAKIFHQQHPNVVVIGDKKGKTLEEALNFEPEKVEIDEELLKLDEPIMEYEEEIIEFFKTEEYCDTKEILEMAKQDAVIKLFKVLDSTLEREVRKFMKHFNKKLLKNRETGIETICIKKDDITSLLDMLRDELQQKENKKQEQLRKEQEKIALKAKLKEEKEQKKQQKKQSASKDASLIPLQIKKYIPKKLWQKIKNLCSKNDFIAKSVLDVISVVNTDINETPVFSSVQIIDEKENTRITSSYLQKESGNCIVQSINDKISNDRKRIVWTYLPKDKALVCISVYNEHYCVSGQNKESLKYSKTLDRAAKGLDDDDKEITMQSIIDGAYLDVEDLLDKYSILQTIDKKEEKTEKPEKQKKVKPIIKTIKPDITTDIKEEKTEETRSRKRPRITKHIVEKVQYTPHQPHVSNLPPFIQQPVDQGVESAIIPQPKTDIIKPVDKVVEETKTEPIKEIKQPVVEKTEENVPATKEEVVVLVEETPHNLVDVIMLEKQIQILIDNINNTINETMPVLIKEQDASKQLEQLDLVRQALVQKEKYQKMLPEFNKTNELLKNIQTKINSHQR